MEFTQALPKQNFRKYIEAELVQHSFAALFVDESWLQAMILLFDAVVLLVELKME